MRAFWRQSLSLAAKVTASSEQSLSSVCRFGRESESPAVHSVQYLVHAFRICVPAVLLLLPLLSIRMKRNIAARKGFFLSDSLLSHIQYEYSITAATSTTLLDKYYAIR